MNNIGVSVDSGLLDVNSGMVEFERRKYGEIAFHTRGGYLDLRSPSGIDKKDYMKDLKQFYSHLNLSEIPLEPGVQIGMLPVSLYNRAFAISSLPPDKTSDVRQLIQGRFPNCFQRIETVGGYLNAGAQTKKDVFVKHRIGTYITSDMMDARELSDVGVRILLLDKSYNRKVRDPASALNPFVSRNIKRIDSWGEIYSMLNGAELNARFNELYRKPKRRKS